MDNQLKPSDGKKVYEPPQLTIISLRPEEAVLSHCKHHTGGGAFGPCAPTGCHSTGS